MPADLLVCNKRLRGFLVLPPREYIERVLRKPRRPRKR